MDTVEFTHYCNDYEFEKTELREYLDLQVELMNIYLIDMRGKGDERDKNIILAEWINTHSQQFRYMWIVLRKGICYD